MSSKPLILGFDTSAAHCAAALVCGDTVLISTAEDMTRGQAERLMPLLETLLAETDHTFGDLTALGVGIGPGNFTGIRISVSAARGLALGLNIPAIGVSTFDATRFGHPGNTVTAVKAPRAQAYIDDPTSDAGPALLPEPEQPVLYQPAPQNLAENIALIAAARRTETHNRPAPLYIRAADAAPARDAPPKIL